MRREDWPARLLATMNAAENRPFSWGNHDCALFAADCALAMTGFDFASPFRGRYKTASGAIKALRSNGARDLADYVTQVLGDPIAPALARRGDVVLFESYDGAMALAINVGADAMAAGPHGLVPVPRSRWHMAWRV